MLVFLERADEFAKPTSALVFSAKSPALSVAFYADWNNIAFMFLFVSVMVVVIPSRSTAINAGECMNTRDSAFSYGFLYRPTSASADSVLFFG
jgi:hypothetical protein